MKIATIGAGNGGGTEERAFAHLCRSALFLLVLIIGISFISGCTVSPSQGEARDTIIKHFEERGYSVRDIRLGMIKAIPTGEKTFMGTPAYNVEIKSITLESAGTRGERTAESLTFKEGVVQIREKPDQKGTWIIYNISGIPAP